MDGDGAAAIAAEVLEIVAGLLRKRPAADVRDELRKLDAKWPAPIAAADVDAAVAEGLARTRPVSSP